MTTAIIGSKGYVGARLSRYLKRLGHKVLEYSSAVTGGIDPGCGLFPQDFAFPSEIDTVYFLAQSPYYNAMPEQSAHLFSVNTIAAIQAAEAARRAKVRRFIYASTGNVYSPSFAPFKESDPVRRDNWYALSKVMAEDALALYRPHFAVSLVRFFGIYGPEQSGKLVPNLINSLISQRDIFIASAPGASAMDGGLRISLMFIDDAVKALQLLAEATVNFDVVNLAGDTNYSIADIVQTAGLALGLEPHLIPAPSPREGDLIADVTLMKTWFSDPLVKLKEGIDLTVAALPR